MASPAVTARSMRSVISGSLRAFLLLFASVSLEETRGAGRPRLTVSFHRRRRGLNPLPVRFSGRERESLSGRRQGVPLSCQDPSRGRSARIPGRLFMRLSAQVEALEIRDSNPIGLSEHPLFRSHPLAGHPPRASWPPRGTTRFAGSTALAKSATPFTPFSFMVPAGGLACRTVAERGAMWPHRPRVHARSYGAGHESSP